MLRSLPMTIALALVIAAGIVHGRWTRRWTTSHVLEEAGSRLERLPMVLGDWHAQALELDREQVALAEIAGYVARRYVDALHKDEVTILLVCGPPGPISVHTPDICYAGAGYELTGPPDQFELPIDPSSPPAVFRNALLSKSNATVPTWLRIIWSWSAAGTWEVPQNPRLAFAPRHVLYKLYVIRGLTSPDAGADDDPSARFLRILLPELERILFRGTNQETGRRGGQHNAHRAPHQVSVTPRPWECFDPPTAPARGILDTPSSPKPGITAVFGGIALPLPGPQQPRRGRRDACDPREGRAIHGESAPVIGRMVDEIKTVQPVMCRFGFANIFSQIDSLVAGYKEMERPG